MISLPKGLILATATAAIFASTLSFAAGSDTKNAQSSTSGKPVKCYGINKCRGKGQCGMPGKNSCAAQNACKGLGWLFLKTEKDCKDKGGKAVS